MAGRCSVLQGLRLTTGRQPAEVDACMIACPRGTARALYPPLGLQTEVRIGPAYTCSTAWHTWSWQEGYFENQRPAQVWRVTEGIAVRITQNRGMSIVWDVGDLRRSKRTLRRNGVGRLLSIGTSCSRDAHLACHYDPVEETITKSIHGVGAQFWLCGHAVAPCRLRSQIVLEFHATIRE